MRLPSRMRNALLAAVAMIVVVVAVTLWRREKPELPSVVPIPQGRAPQLDANWHGALLLAPNGTIWTWGDVPGNFGRPTHLPRQIGEDSDWAQISLGGSFCVALKNDGSLWGWGANNGGALFTAARTSAKTPIRLGSETNWLQITAGTDHVVALKRDRTLWAWGYNRYGQVGNGTTTNQFAPVQISTNLWTAIATGIPNSFALHEDGTVWGWGFSLALGPSGHVLVPSRLDPPAKFVAISAGDFHICALKADGTLWTNGRNAARIDPTYSWPNSPTNLVQIGTEADWRQVYSGGSSVFVRKANGSWWAAGDDHKRQLGVGGGSRVKEMTKLGFGFEPWAFAVGGTSTHLVTGDGSLWTWGQYVGGPFRSVPLKGLKHRLNRTGFAHFNTNDVPQLNLVPKKIWQVPTNVLK